MTIVRPDCLPVFQKLLDRLTKPDGSIEMMKAVRLRNDGVVLSSWTDYEWELGLNKAPDDRMGPAATPPNYRGEGFNRTPQDLWVPSGLGAFFFIPGKLLPQPCCCGTPAYGWKTAFIKATAKRSEVLFAYADDYCSLETYTSLRSPFHAGGAFKSLWINDFTPVPPTTF